MRLDPPRSQNRRAVCEQSAGGGSSRERVLLVRRLPVQRAAEDLGEGAKQVAQTRDFRVECGNRRGQRDSVQVLSAVCSRERRSLFVELAACGRE